MKNRDQLESIRKRALQITCGSCNNDYEQLCILYNLPALFECRETLCERFYGKYLLNPISCLHYLLPLCTDINIIDKFQHANVHTTPTVREKRFRKSFMVYALDNYKYILRSCT